MTITLVEASPHEMGEGVLGLWDPIPKPRILIQRGLEEEWRRQTLLHEILHGIDELYGAGLGERRIRLLETVLTSVVQDNPHLKLF